MSFALHERIYGVNFLMAVKSKNIFGINMRTEIRSSIHIVIYGSQSRTSDLCKIMARFRLFLLVLLVNLAFASIIEG